MAMFLDSFNDLKELGIDCETSDSLTETFNKAADHLQNLLPNLDNQTLLTLYGYYKQGSHGPCNTPKPSWYDMKAKSKWEAWNKLGEMSQNEAKSIYIETIRKIDPNFNTTAKESWICISTFQNSEKRCDSDSKTIFDHVKEINCLEVEKCLKTPGGKELLTKLDEDGLGLIHWAADRGSVDILKIILSLGVDINLQDSEGQTALHYASSCGHVDCIRLLLENNAKRDILDNDGCSPVVVACDENVKELIAHFT